MTPRAPRPAPAPGDPPVAAPARAAAAVPTIAVQHGRGRPKLEALDGGLGAAAPGTPPGKPQPLPPPPAAAAPVFGPEGPPQTERRPWTPEEAALAATGAHNIGWSAGLFMRKELTERELLEKAYADPKELESAAPSIGRILDKTPLEPGGAGTLGLIGDILVTAQAMLSLEVRHATLVQEARKRLKAKDRPQSGARTGPADAPQPRPPEAPPRPFAPQEEPEEGPDDAAFHFRPDQLAILKAPAQ